MKRYNVAVVGATGAVGREMLSCLERHDFPVNEIRLLASARSKGLKFSFKGREVLVEELTKDSCKGVDLALFSAGASISGEFAPIFASNGVFVIDNSSRWRMEKDIPLVVPEVNPGAVSKDTKIIANPNCSTIQMVVVLKPLHDAAVIKRVVVSTYQAVSGAGQSGIQDLENQIREIEAGQPLTKKKFPHQIAFNVIPHIDVFLDNFYTKEEIKMVSETRKIMGDDSIEVSPTCVRVPVFRGHSEAVNLEFRKKISRAEAMKILSSAPGVVVKDDVSSNTYPMPIDAEDDERTFVGRIREDKSVKNGLNLWIVSDNLLKGAASNAVQIAELLIQKEII